jgi:drug/metabolite transporter (DMT)-like permease
VANFAPTFGDHDGMDINRRRAAAALTAAGLLWGTTVPLSKLALEWLPAGWLTFARFGMAAAILLLAARRRGVRVACTPRLLASGALGYGGSVVVQNAGITRTSVTHAALLIGAVPVMVAIVAALWRRTVARPVAWAGFALSLAGVGLITGGQGGGATVIGDGLVLASLMLSAVFTVAQGSLLSGRDPVAVTAAQFLGAALAALPFSVITEGMPAVPHNPGVVLATVALAAGGTVLPFTLFAFGQSRVSAEVAGAFYNIEPLVGAVAGIVLFGDPAGLAQAVGGAAIIAGIALSSLPLLSSGARPAGPAAVVSQAPPGRRGAPGEVVRPGGGAIRWPAARRRPRRGARPGRRGPAAAALPRRSPGGGPERGSARSRARCAERPVRGRARRTRDREPRPRPATPARGPRSRRRSSIRSPRYASRG